MAESMADNKIFLIICAILLPPVAVGIKTGFGVHLVINVLLWFFFVIPGIIHALWVVLKK